MTLEKRFKEYAEERTVLSLKIDNLTLEQKEVPDDIVERWAVLTDNIDFILSQHIKIKEVV